MKSLVINTMYVDCIDFIKGKISFGINVSFVRKEISLLADGKLPNSVLFGEKVAINFITES